ASQTLPNRTKLRSSGEMPNGDTAGKSEKLSGNVYACTAIRRVSTTQPPTSYNPGVSKVRRLTRPRATWRAPLRNLAVSDVSTEPSAYAQPGTWIVRNCPAFSVST